MITAIRFFVVRSDASKPFLLNGYLSQYIIFLVEEASKSYTCSLKGNSVNFLNFTRSFNYHYLGFWLLGWWQLLSWEWYCWVIMYIWAEFPRVCRLPVPWLMFSIVHGLAPVAVSSNGLFCAIVLLFLMLLFVIISIAVCKWKMNKMLGFTMFLLYFVFLVLSVMLEDRIIVCPVSIWAAHWLPV